MPRADQQTIEAAAPGDRGSATTEQTLAVLWKRRITFVVAFVATLATAAIVTFSLPKAYSTHAILLVTPTKAVSSDFAATQLSQTLAKTYAELLQAPSVADRVAAELPFKTTSSDLQSSVSVSPITNSELLEIQAEAGSPERAQTIANTYADVFVKRTAELNTALTGAARLTLAEPAALSTSPSRPQPKLYLAVAVVLAAFVAAGAALLRERLFQGLDIDSSTTTIFGLPVIGRVPKSSLLSLALSEPESLAARVASEPFRLLYANLSFLVESRQPMSIVIASSDRGEGKSECAANLASVGAQLNQATLLADADLRLNTLTHRVIGQPPAQGVSRFLSGPGEQQQFEELLRDVPGTALTFAPSGPPPANPSRLLTSRGLRRFDELAKSEFDLVIYDAPPLSVGADASLLAAEVDGVLLVIDAERTRRKAAVRAVDQLRRARATILGIVINRAPDISVSHGYYYAGPAEHRGGSDGQEGHATRRSRSERRRQATPDDRV